MKPNANPFRGVVLLICVLALIFCATSIFRTTTHQTTYSYADIRDLFQQEKVETPPSLASSSEKLLDPSPS